MLLGAVASGEHPMIHQREKKEVVECDKRLPRR